MAAAEEMEETRMMRTKSPMHKERHLKSMGDVRGASTAKMGRHETESMETGGIKIVERSMRTPSQRPTLTAVEK